MSKKNRTKKRQLIAQRRAEKNKLRENKEISSYRKLALVDKITGADFVENDTITSLQSKIDNITISEQRRKVLFTGEASFLKTGFSTYYRHLLPRLHATNKFSIIEQGSYANDLDAEAQKLPWKFYGVMPKNDAEAKIYGMVNGKVINQDYNENQFGKWKLPYVLAKEKPDIVVSLTDEWMIRYIGQNPLRKNFTWLHLACVDSCNQKKDWLKTYSGPDHLLAYSHFGKRVLEEESRSLYHRANGIKPLTVQRVAQAGVETNIFRPIDKEEVKKIFGIPSQYKFIGTVMRNQPRKLFPRIIEAFRLLKENHFDEVKNTLLFLHTSYPDVGWDIPEIVQQNGLHDHVVYTYLCVRCGRVAISNFIGSPTNCIFCHGANCFIMPNTKYGLPDDQFNLIYNLMDIYVQASIAGADEMPITEAKSAGTCCLVSDYAAMSEKTKNGGALPIKNATLYMEHETGQYRSMCDINDLKEKLLLLITNDALRNKLANEARECALKYYDWDLCAKKWEYELLNIPVKNRKDTWEKPIEIKTILNINEPQLTNDFLGIKQWLDWCYINILKRPKGVDPEGLNYWSNIILKNQDRDKAKLDIKKHFTKMIEEENSINKLLIDPELANTNPIERTKHIIENIETNNK